MLRLALKVGGNVRVPMKVDYGVRALVDLAQQGSARPIRTNEIAKRQHIPEPYLDQVLTNLNMRQAWLVQN